MNQQNNEPLASIGIFAYNGKKFIREAIESVLNQNYKNLELVISDDFSQDGTEEICREFEKNDSRVKYFRQAKNIGGYLNANFVLQKSTGKYFAWLAHDDCLESEFIEKLVTYLESHPQCILASGDVAFMDENGSSLQIEYLTKLREEINWPARMREFFTYPLSRSFLSIYGLMRLEPVKKIFPGVPYPKKGTKGTEMLMLDRFATVGEIVALPQILRRQRTHDKSMYNSEFNKLKQKNFLYRKFILLKNIWLIRLDQLKVLFGSNISASQKIGIFLTVYFLYVKNYFLRIIKFPKKLFK